MRIAGCTTSRDGSCSRAAKRALCVHVTSHPELLSPVRGQEQYRCLFLFNADAGAVSFILPKAVAGPWRAAFDTAEQEAPGTLRAPGDEVVIPPFSAIVYQGRPGE
jgi:hypothetical protein